MGKKNRNKKKDFKKKKKYEQSKNNSNIPIKKPPTIKPLNQTNKIIKEGTESELQTELSRLYELNRKNPTKNTKNKQKRRELVTMRTSLKKRLKSKLRRIHQDRLNNLSEEEQKKEKEKNQPKTIDMMREIDENLIDEVIRPISSDKAIQRALTLLNN